MSLASKYFCDWADFRSALLARLVLAFKITESSDPNARKPNSDMLAFSAEYSSLVAMPDRFDCCFEARDESWIKTKIGF